MGKPPKQLAKHSAELAAKSKIGLKHGQKPVSVMFPPELDVWVRSLDNRSEFIRQAVVEKLERESEKLSAATVDNPLVREAIANSIALQREALAAEKKRLSKADQSLIERWSFEIKQLEELL